MDIVEILGKIGFDWRMALANFVNFLIIFWLLKRYAFKPIKKMISDRQNTIKEGLDTAEKAKTELTMAEETYERKLQEAREEGNIIVARAHDQAEQMMKRAEARAQEKVEKIVTEAREAIAQERDRMQQKLQAQTVSIAVAIAEKILKTKLDEQQEAELIKKLTK